MTDSEKLRIAREATEALMDAKRAVYALGLHDTETETVMYPLSCLSVGLHALKDALAALAEPENCNFCGHPVQRHAQLGCALRDCPCGRTQHTVRAEPELATKHDSSESGSESEEMPAWLQDRVQQWLRANQLSADQVRHDRLPLGMVARWIERAEAAERRLKKLEPIARDWLATMQADEYECTCEEDVCPLCRCKAALGVTE